MDFNKAEKASHIIDALEKLIAEHGDLPLCADDPDTGLRLPVDIVHKKANLNEDWPERFEIKTDYCGPSEEEIKNYEQYKRMNPCYKS